jgi:hypothetical protein
MRRNRGQEFVIGRYTQGKGFDVLIFGYQDGASLLFAGGTRSGFTPASRGQLFPALRWTHGRGVSVRESPGGDQRTLGQG